jgi:SAM-dependent methyltransferase
MERVPAELAGNPDRLRWNAKYEARAAENHTGEAHGGPSFEAHPLAVGALSMRLPAGPVLELACGPSGSALLAAESGRRVTAVDVSDMALRLLAAEAERRGARELITPIQADLTAWRPEADRYCLVLCTGYWDRALFAAAAAAVLPGGLLGWQALTEEARRIRPSLPPAWCLGPGEPEALLPPGFEVLDLSSGQPDTGPATTRRTLARRKPAPQSP